jgi:hypothetical protein
VGCGEDRLTSRQLIDNVNATCTGDAPDNELFAEDFKNVMANIRWLTDQVGIQIGADQDVRVSNMSTNLDMRYLRYKLLSPILFGI